MLIINNEDKQRIGVRVYLTPDLNWWFIAKSVQMRGDPDDGTTMVIIETADDMQHEFLISGRAGHFVHKVILEPGQEVDI